MNAIYVCGLAGNVKVTTDLAKNFLTNPKVEDVTVKRYEIVTRAGRKAPAVCCMVKTVKDLVRENKGVAND